jgi:glycosyltransferase involved in cell wall biosynthesis
MTEKDFDSSRRVMLFEPRSHGHHPVYIRHLVEYWSEQRLPGRLDVVVAPSFLEEHSLHTVAEHPEANVHFCVMTGEEKAMLKSADKTNPTFLTFLKSGMNPDSRAVHEWRLLGKYARLLDATHALVMYLDSCLLAAAEGKESPCSFSGIHFRPTFHYSELTHQSRSREEQSQHMQEKFVLTRVLRHPQLRTFFSLDPFAFKQLARLGGDKVVYLPDPVRANNAAPDRVEELRKRLGIDPGRRVFLLFGELTGRKGIHQLLEAVRLLPAGLCSEVCLAIIGRVHPSEKAAIDAHLAVAESGPLQIVRQNGFVPEAEVPLYFQLADVVLAPYQRHIGMSGILLLAAAAQRPVLSSDYGLMGEVVRQHKLGLTVDSTAPGEIAGGLARYMMECPAKLCDPVKMKSLVDRHSVETFARTIFERV